MAVALFLARAGVPLPVFDLPEHYRDPSFLERVFGFLFISLAGAVQGLLLVAAVLGAALLVRWAGAFAFRSGPAGTAREIDRRLGTERFSAALEAEGPLAPLVRKGAVTAPPPAGLLVPRVRPWFRRSIWISALLVLLVALMPGTAPGGEGPAPVAGEPAGERGEEAVRLTLAGERETYLPRQPVPVQVLAEAAAAPAEDLDLPLEIVLDGGAAIATGDRIFLPAGAPGQDMRVLDLRALAGRLEPGEHRAVARAGPLESNEYVFRIEAPPDGGGGTSPPPAPPDPSGGAGSPPGGNRPELRPKFVEPLVRDGEKVRKMARVPIESQGGGAPAERTLEEAWPELERRKEAALKRPGLSPAARELVRRYFDRLRPEEEK